MRILALDPGEKRIGAALSDALGLTAQGLGFIDNSEPARALEEIAEICREREVAKVVVGNPLHMDGSIGEASRRAGRLAAKLRAKLDRPVVLVDERLTSLSAEKTLIAAGMSRKKRRNKRDTLAAVLILEGYLARAGKNETES